MFSMRSIASFLAVATLMVGVQGAPTGSEGANNCNVNQQQCCTTTYNTNAPNFPVIAGILGISANVVGPLVGVGCSPIVAVGGSASCNANPVCCTGNQFNGLVNVGCTSIAI